MKTFRRLISIILPLALLLPLASLPSAQAAGNQSPPVFVRQWGSLGTAPGDLSMPWGIAVGPQQRIFVSDYGNDRIQVFSADGKVLSVWGSQGSAPGKFLGPVGIAVGPAGDVYVSDSSNHRVQVFGSDGTFVRSWSGPMQGTHFFTPWGIAVDGTGAVYVSDLNANRIYKFAPDGTLLTQWGQQGFGDGQFNGPTGLAVSPSGLLYAVDSLNYRVQVFTLDGQFQFKWGSLCDLYFHPGAGCTVRDGSGPLASGDGQFASPWGINFGPSGRVYVADSANKRIEAFTPQGQFLFKWGSLGSAPGQFNNSVGVATDASDDVYVADLNNNRVQKFSYAGVQSLSAKLGGGLRAGASQ